MVREMINQKHTLRNWFNENGVKILLTILGWFSILIAFYFSTNFRLTALEEDVVIAKGRLDNTEDWQNDMDVEIGTIQTKLDLLLDNFNLEYQEDPEK